MTTTHRALTFLGTLTAGAMIAASTIATAHAEPAPIDDGSSPRDVGAEIDDGSGAPGPSFDEPVSIPSVGPAPVHPGPGATPQEIADYKAAVAEHDRQVNARTQAQSLEAARIAAKAYRDCINAGGDQDRVC